MRHLSPRSAFVLLFLVGLLPGALYVSEVASRQQVRQRQACEAELAQAVARIGDRFRASSMAVSALANCFEAIRTVDGPIFSKLTWSLIDEADGLQVAELAIEVPHENRARFERDCLGGKRILEIVPAAGGKPSPERVVVSGKRNSYAAVIYVAPQQSDAGAVGLDLMSEEVRRETLLRASATEKTEFSAPIQLVQDKTGSLSIIAVHPIASLELPNYPKARGFVVALLRLPGIVGTINRPLNDCLITGIYDISFNRRHEAWRSLDPRSGETIEAVFTVGQRKFLAEAVILRQGNSSAFLILNTAVGALLIALLLGLVGRAVVVQRVAEERHRRELQELAAELMERDVQPPR